MLWGMVMYEAYTGAHLFAGLEENAVIGKVLYEPRSSRRLLPSPHHRPLLRW